MESFCWTKFNLKFWLIKVATFCRYNSRTYSRHSFYNGNQILFRKFFPTPLQKFHKWVALVGCFAFTLLSSSSQTSSMEFKSGDCAGHYMICNDTWFAGGRSSDVAWRYVLGRCLAVGWTPDQLDIDQRVLHGAAKCCGSPFGSGCQSLCASRPLWIQQKSPTSHASSSMFDSWCHTLRNHPFASSTVFKNPAWWTEDFKFWFIGPLDLLPVFSCPLVVLHGPGKSLFLILPS